MTGIDGIMVEIHESPETALSNGFQNPDFQEASLLYEKPFQTYTFSKEL